MSTQRETAEKTVRRPPFGAPRVFVLAVIDGADAHGCHRIAEPETLLGRGPDAELRIEDPEISKRHCVIRVDGAVCELVDLESRNGTFLNGRLQRPGVATRLRHLDEIVVGSTRLLLLTGRFRREPKAD